MKLTAESLTKWSKANLNYTQGPEFLPSETPWGYMAWSIDEGRSRDIPSMYYIICELNGRFFEANGYYSSWEGTDWSAQDWEWTEVEKKTRTETYWGAL